MNSLAALFAPLVLLMPSSTGIVAVDEAELVPREAAERPIAAEPGQHGLDAPHTVPVIAEQVRIERRVTIRVAPRSPQPRQSLMAELAPLSAPSTLIERKMGKCVPVAGIAGVQTGQGNRLLLYMRDQRIVSANLEKACRARDFYSGFYLERTSDGMLCVDRDRLHSRTGSQCQVSRMRQLVAEE